MYTFSRKVSKNRRLYEGELKWHLVSKTQKQLEKLTGVRQPTIAKIENGSMNPSVEVVMKLLAAMGKTLKIASL